MNANLAEQRMDATTKARIVARRARLLEQASGRHLFRWKDILPLLLALICGALAFTVPRQDLYPAIPSAFAVLWLGAAAFAHLGRRLDAIVRLLTDEPPAPDSASAAV